MIMDNGNVRASRGMWNHRKLNKRKKKKGSSGDEGQFHALERQRKSVQKIFFVLVSVPRRQGSISFLVFKAMRPPILG